jgi:hypothetical protein
MIGQAKTTSHSFRMIHIILQGPLTPKNSEV